MRTTADGSTAADAVERSAAGEVAILPNPGDALRRQAPTTVDLQRNEALIAQRLQVQGRAHVAVPSPDGLIDGRNRDAHGRVSARQIPERAENMDEVAAAHRPIVASRTAACGGMRIWFWRMDCIHVAVGRPSHHVTTQPTQRPSRLWPSFKAICGRRDHDAGRPVRIPLR